MKYNYKMIIQYDGTRYDGWQKQGTTENTIQGKLENVLSRILEEEIKIHGSGRTDTGVHAYGQVANFHTEKTEYKGEPLETALKKLLEEYLPQDIRVPVVKRAGERFHSRLNARSKKYIYYIDNREILNPFQRKYSYHCPDILDITRMKEGAEFLIGEHDFAPFSSVKKTKKSTVRTIYHIEIKEENQEIQIEIHGNGFLYHMVRIITGTLIEIGKGNFLPEDITNILEKKDKSYAGPMAPAHGLFLKEVEY